MNQTWENGKKPSSGHNFRSFGTNLDPQNFFSYIIPLQYVRHCCKLSLHAISKKLRHQIWENDRKTSSLEPNFGPKFRLPIFFFFFFFKNLALEGENISPIISLHSYTRYLESSPALFHWLFAFFTMNTDICGFHNIDNDTFLIENYVLLLLRLRIYNTRKYGCYLLRIF